MRLRQEKSSNEKSVYLAKKQFDDERFYAETSENEHIMNCRFDYNQEQKTSKNFRKQTYNVMYFKQRANGFMKKTEQLGSDERRKEQGS